MINYDTIISAYKDRPTLMQWLKKVEKALNDVSATSFSVVKKGDATISFKIDFADGSSLESGEIILQQGESVTGASIVNGHLILTLSNGDNIDAGNLGAVSGFSINASQHLIVTYQDGTSFDLGAIFNGNVNISGILSVTGNSSVSGDLSVNGKISGGEILETMAGYSYSYTGTLCEIDYAGVVKNGNKITFVISGKVNTNEVLPMGNVFNIGTFVIPASVGSKLVPNTGDRIGYKAFRLCVNTYYGINCNSFLTKNSDTSIYFSLGLSEPSEANKTYFFRFEETFLLGTNLAA